MTKIYKCNICGNVVELLHVGGGELVCCGQPMELLAEKTQDEGSEKHVPVIETTANGIKVKVGSEPHPMVKDHYIAWIEVINGDQTCLKSLKPGDAPEADFEVKATQAREYCTKHGLWKNV